MSDYFYSLETAVLCYVIWTDDFSRVESLLTALSNEENQ